MKRPNTLVIIVLVCWVGLICAVLAMQPAGRNNGTPLIIARPTAFVDATRRLSAPDTRTVLANSTRTTIALDRYETLGGLAQWAAYALLVWSCA